MFKNLFTSSRRRAPRTIARTDVRPPAPQPRMRWYS
jgi:hypothetical protein